MKNPKNELLVLGHSAFFIWHYRRNNDLGGSPLGLGEKWPRPRRHLDQKENDNDLKRCMSSWPRHRIRARCECSIT